VTAQTAAWLLLSVEAAAGSGPADLEAIVSTADVINHAVPTADELSSCLTTLVHLGLVTHEAGQYGVSAAGLAALGQPPEALTLPPRKRLGLLVQQLTPLVAGFAVEPSTPMTPSLEEARAAVRAYGQRVAPILARANEVYPHVLASQPALHDEPSAVKRFVSKWLGRYKR